VNLMITLLESSVQFLGSLAPRYHEFASLQDSSTVGLLQVETFLHMFSALLNDYFTHDQRKLKSLGGSFVSKCDAASVNDSQSIGQTSCSSTASVERVDGRLSETVENLSSATDDCTALRRLLALAYIWGFGSSVLDRYWLIIVASVWSKVCQIFSLFLDVCVCACVCEHAVLLISSLREQNLITVTLLYLLIICLDCAIIKQEVKVI